MRRKNGVPLTAGFTIVELTVALFLFALLFGSIGIPLQTQIENRKIEQTERLLHEAREALLGYAAAHGYFPCPATAASAGQEPAGSDHASGVCPTYHGFLPAATLSFPGSDWQGYGADGWGGAVNRIRYAVARQSVGPGTHANTFTRTNGMRTAGIARLAAPSLSLLHVCSSGTGVAAGRSCGRAATIVSTTPVVLWSVGANAAAGGRSVDEAQNPNPNGGSADAVFVSRVRSTIAGNEFDDIVTWIPMPVVVSRMVVAGQLP